MSSRSALPLELRLKMLGSVLDFMSRAGMSEAAIKETFEKSLIAMSERASKRGADVSNPIRSGNENLSAELLRKWHRDSRYIDCDARPRPLHISKGRYSLLSTIRTLDPQANAGEIVDEMKAVNLIRRTSNGTYLPTSEAAIVQTLHPLAIDHIAKLVIRLVSTVSRNVDPTPESLPLIERHAYAPDLDASERQAFSEFTRVLGMTFLESVDNWLEQRRVRRRVSDGDTSSVGVSASVHLFAYLGDEGMNSHVLPNDLPRRKKGNFERPGQSKPRKRPTSPRATRA